VHIRPRLRAPSGTRMTKTTHSRITIPRLGQRWWRTGAVTTVAALGVMLLAGPAISANAANRAPLAASGGGCRPYGNPDVDVVQIQSCVTENSSYNIVSDVHLQTRSGPYRLAECSFTISVRDDTLKTTVARQSFLSCGTTPGSVSHPAVTGHHYHTYVQATFTYAIGVVTHDPIIYNSPEQIANVPVVVNPLWSQAYKVAFGAPPALAAHATYVKAAGATTDDGIVFVRLFIPYSTAAHDVMLGDDRGFSAAPGASSRGVLAWDTRTGQVSLTVTHSTLVGHNHRQIMALPITTLPMSADFHQDQARFVNEIGLGSNAGSNNLMARISLLNPVTNPGWGAWSVDYTLTVTRTAANAYRLTKLTGNGYPAIEVYYYPHHIAANAPQADVIAKRSVDPQFVGAFGDKGGGGAAFDYFSWNNCGYVPGTLTVRCANTVPLSHANQWPWNWVIWGPGVSPPSPWQKPWETAANAASAL
jgi:hypothetical protein